jgi:hypothetical protein
VTAPGPRVPNEGTLDAEKHLEAHFYKLPEGDGVKVTSLVGFRLLSRPLSVMLDVLVRSHVRAAMAESWMPSQICLQFEGAALQKQSSLSCGNCVAGWDFE